MEINVSEATLIHEIIAWLEFKTKFVDTENCFVL
jgi:hypothetical protein